MHLYKYMRRIIKVPALYVKLRDSCVINHIRGMLCVSIHRVELLEALKFAVFLRQG